MSSITELESEFLNYERSVNSTIQKSKKFKVNLDKFITNQKQDFGLMDGVLYPVSRFKNFGHIVSEDVFIDGEVFNGLPLSVEAGSVLSRNSEGGFLCYAINGTFMSTRSKETVIEVSGVLSDAGVCYPSGGFNVEILHRFENPVASVRSSGSVKVNGLWENASEGVVLFDDYVVSEYESTPQVFDQPPIAVRAGLRCFSEASVRESIPYENFVPVKYHPGIPLGESGFVNTRTFQFTTLPEYMELYIPGVFPFVLRFTSDIPESAMEIPIQSSTVRMYSVESRIHVVHPRGLNLEEVLKLVSEYLGKLQLESGYTSFSLWVRHPLEWDISLSGGYLTLDTIKRSDLEVKEKRVLLDNGNSVAFRENSGLLFTSSLNRGYFFGSLFSVYIPINRQVDGSFQPVDPSNFKVDSVELLPENGFNSLGEYFITYNDRGIYIHGTISNSIVRNRANLIVRYTSGVSKGISTRQLELSEAPKVYVSSKGTVKSESKLLSFDIFSEGFNSLSLNKELHDSVGAVIGEDSTYAMHFTPSGVEIDLSGKDRVDLEPGWNQIAVHKDLFFSPVVDRGPENPESPYSKVEEVLADRAIDSGGVLNVGFLNITTSELITNFGGWVKVGVKFFRIKEVLDVEMVLDNYTEGAYEGEVTLVVNTQSYRRYANQFYQSSNEDIPIRIRQTASPLFYIAADREYPTNTLVENRRSDFSWGIVVDSNDQEVGVIDCNSFMSEGIGDTDIAALIPSSGPRWSNFYASSVPLPRVSKFDLKYNLPEDLVAFAYDDLSGNLILPFIQNYEKIEVLEVLEKTNYGGIILTDKPVFVGDLIGGRYYVKSVEMVGTTPLISVVTQSEIVPGVYSTSRTQSTIMKSHFISGGIHQATYSPYEVLTADAPSQVVERVLTTDDVIIESDLQVI